MSKLSRMVPKTQCDPYSLVNLTTNIKKMYAINEISCRTRYLRICYYIVTNSENILIEFVTSTLLLTIYNSGLVNRLVFPIPLLRNYYALYFTK